MKKITAILFLLIAAMALLLAVMSTANEDVPVIYKNDIKYINEEYPAELIDGEVYLPISFFLGLKNIQYEHSAKPVGFYLRNSVTAHYLAFSASSELIVVDGDLTDVKFPIKNSTVYIPLEYCASLLSLSIEKKTDSSVVRIRLCDGSEKMTFDRLIELYDPTEPEEAVPTQPEKPVEAPTEVPTEQSKPTIEAPSEQSKPTTETPSEQSKPTTETTTETEKPSESSKPTTETPSEQSKPTTETTTETEKPVEAPTEAPTVPEEAVPTEPEKPTTEAPSEQSKPTTETTTESESELKERYLYIAIEKAPRDSTAELLDMLEKSDIKAAFFFDTEGITAHPELVVKAFVLGHSIGIYADSIAEAEEANAALYSVLKFKTRLCSTSNAALLEANGYICPTFDIEADGIEGSVRNAAKAIYNKTFEKTSTVVAFSSEQRTTEIIERILYYTSGDSYITDMLLTPTAVIK